MYLWKTWVYLKFASNLPSEITSSLKKCSKAISVKRLMKAENHPIIQALKKYFFLSDVCKVNIYKEWTDAITLTTKHLRIDTETDFVNKCSKLLQVLQSKLYFHTICSSEPARQRKNIQKGVEKSDTDSTNFWTLKI